MFRNPWEIDWSDPEQVRQETFFARQNPLQPPLATALSATSRPRDSDQVFQPQQATVEAYSTRRPAPVVHSAAPRVNGNSTRQGGRASPPDDQSRELRAEALHKIRLAQDLIERSHHGWFTTGFLAPTLASIDGSTAAGNAAADVQTLRAPGALLRTLDLNRRAGRNPLTPNSDRAFRAFADSLANLDVGQSDEQFQRDAGTIADMYIRSYLAAGGTEDELRQAGVALPIPGGPPVLHDFADQFPEDDPRDFTDEQREQIRRYVTRARSPEDLAAFAERLSGGRITIPLGRGREVLDHYRQTGLVGGVTPIPPPDISDVRGRGGTGETADAALRGVADTPTFGLADEFAARANTIFNGGTYIDNLARERAIDRYDTEHNFGARVTGQVVGGLAVPTRVPSAAYQAGLKSLQSGRGMVRARAAARAAARAQLARDGAFFSGAYGFGSSEGDTLDRLSRAAFGAGIGGVGGLTVGHLLGRLAPVSLRRPRGLPAPSSVDPREFRRSIAQGFPSDVARHLAKPYPVTGRGSHFVSVSLGKRLGLPKWVVDSRFNVVKPSGITRGELYRRHAMADRRFRYARLPANLSRRSWSAEQAGIGKPGIFSILWHGSPRPLKTAIGATGGAIYLAEQED